MNIAFIGNQDNNAYRLCRWIREKGISAHLYMMRKQHVRSLPEKIHRELKDSGYPNWIHTYDNTRQFWFLRYDKNVAQIENNHDIVVTSGSNGLLAARKIRHTPIIHLSLGSEVTEFPFLLFRRGATWRERLSSILFREGLSKADRIITGFRPTIKALMRTKYHHRVRMWGFPEDVVSNSSLVDKRLLKTLNARYCNYDKVFMWLSRINYLDTSSSSYKGPEKFIAALKKIVLMNQYNVRAIIGTHGNDVKEFKTLIADEGLEDYVDYVPHLPYWKLLTYLSINNALIFDGIDKEKGSLSGIAREALSVGAVMVKAIDSDLIQTCFGGNCPVIDAHDVQTCYDAMVKVLNCDNKEFQRLQQEYVKWANEYLHYEEKIPKFLEILRETIYCHTTR
jgi:hypothetical protein